MGSNERQPEYQEMQELRELYETIYKNGCFVKEFAWSEDSYGAAVGEQQKLKEFMGVSDDYEITSEDIEELPPLLLFAVPGSGPTRTAAVREAYSLLQAEKSKSEDEPDLYGEFEEKGYKVRAFMPRNANQPCEWKLVVEKDDEIVHEEVIPMLYEPIFGADVGDVATLEQVTDKVLRELNGS